MAPEIFKEINFSDGLYEVSNYGRVRSCRKKYNFFLKQWDNIRGYKMVGLTINGIYKQWFVHHLVAYAFLNFKGGGITDHNSLVIDHIDNNKTNNNLSNLQIITHSKNLKKDRINGAAKGVYFDGKKYNSYIHFMGKKYHLGRFLTYEDAKEKLKKIELLLESNRFYNSTNPTTKTTQQ